VIICAFINTLEYRQVTDHAASVKVLKSLDMISFAQRLLESYGKSHVENDMVSIVRNLQVTVAWVNRSCRVLIRRCAEESSKAFPKELQNLTANKVVIPYDLLLPAISLLIGAYHMRSPRPEQMVAQQHSN
jgi:hypothetical protein